MIKPGLEKFDSPIVLINQEHEGEDWGVAAGKGDGGNIFFSGCYIHRRHLYFQPGCPATGVQIFYSDCSSR